MAIVVTFHSLLYYISNDSGTIEVIPWGPGPVLWVASWLFCLLPLFFLASGYGSAVAVRRDQQQGRSYAEYLHSRLRKLCGPLTGFIAVFTLVSTLGAWLVDYEQAVELSERFAQLLWFLVIYLVLQAAAWALVRLTGHQMLIAAVLITIVALGVDVAARVSGDWDIHWLNLLTVWPLVFILGIAYQQGRFERPPIWGLGLIAAGMWGLIVWQVMVLGYPSTAVGWADQVSNNLQPPTVAALWMSGAQVCLLAILGRLGVARRLSAGAQALLQQANALVLTTYLWHIPCIVLAGAVLAGLSLLVPALSQVVLSGLALTLLTWLLVVVLIPRIARIEVRLIPPSTTRMPRTPRVMLGLLLLVGGLWSVWQFGAVIHPRAPLACVAVFIVAAGICTVWFPTPAARATRLRQAAR
jgi:hypothetical protein